MTERAAQGRTMATQPNTAADHLRSLGDRQRLLEAAGWLLCLIRVLVAACLGSLLGALLFLVIFVFSDQFDGVYLIDGIVGGATWGVIFVCVVVIIYLQLLLIAHLDRFASVAIRIRGLFGNSLIVWDEQATFPK